MLDISSKISKNLQSYQLFYSAKSCFVIARFCIEAAFMDFYIPGFLLMHQSIENFIKSFLKKANIVWQTGKEGHNLKKLIEYGKNINFFKTKILNRPDFLNLLNELASGYNLQRYGESGHFIKDGDRMMDLFDELIYLFITGYVAFVGQKDNERLMALPMPAYLEKTFKRKLKQSFIFTNVFEMEN